MENNTSRSGIAALVMVMVILGLLMSVSTSYVTMVQTENQVQTMAEDSNRAMDAAFAGINYAISVLQKNPGVFTSDPFKSTLFTRTAEVSTSDGVKKVKSEWVRMGEGNFTFFDEDSGESVASAPYLFRVSIPGPSQYRQYTASGTVTIKCQGKYISQASGDEPVEMQSQIIAFCTIDHNRRIIQIKKYKQMNWETDESFFTSTSY